MSDKRNHQRTLVRCQIELHLDHHTDKAELHAQRSNAGNQPYKLFLVALGQLGSGFAGKTLL